MPSSKIADETMNWRRSIPFQYDPQLRIVFSRVELPPPCSLLFPAVSPTSASSNCSRWQLQPAVPSAASLDAVRVPVRTAPWDAVLSRKKNVEVAI